MKKKDKELMDHLMTKHAKAWEKLADVEQEPTEDCYCHCHHSGRGLDKVFCEHCQPKTEGRECTRCGISYITESQFKYHKCCPEPLKEMPQVPCPKDCKDKDDAGHFHLAEPLKETSCGIKHKHNYYDCCAECLTPVDGKHTKNCTHCKPSNTSWEDKIYKILYKKSILCFGVRCINEDEWPLGEISGFISQERKRIREEIKSMENRYVSNTLSADAYEQAIKDILAELDNQGDM